MLELEVKKGDDSGQIKEFHRTDKPVKIGRNDRDSQGIPCEIYAFECLPLSESSECTLKSHAF